MNCSTTSVRDQLSCIWPYLASLSLCAIVLGCGRSSSEPVRVPVTGRVTFAGQPVPYGEIVFLPEPSTVAKQTPGTATIVDGQIQTPQGQGPSAGQFIVIVHGYRSAEVDGPQGRPLLFSEHRVPITVAADQPAVTIEVPKSAGI